MTLGYKNGALVRSDGRLCTNCCDALIAVTGSAMAGLTASGTVRWDDVVGAYDIVKTSAVIYSAVGNGVRRYTLSGAFTDKLTALNTRGIDVDSSGNIYIAHVRAGGVSVTKVNSAGASQWTYDTGGNALKIKLNADESQVAVVGDRADNGGGNKTLWVLATTDGAEQWTYQDAHNPLTVVSVDWDSFGNVYIVDPRGTAGCYKISSAPARVWQWDVCTEAGGVCTDLSTYAHVTTDSVNVYLSISSTGVMYALTVRGDAGEGREVWDGISTVAASALDSGGSLYTVSPGGDVQEIDPSDGSVIWTAGSVLGTGLAIHAGSKAGALPWACGNNYIAGDLSDHGGTTYQAKLPHISCGDALWAAGNYTIGDRVYYPSQTTDNAYRLTNSNKTGADTDPPGTDADWIADNDEPGAGNNWTDYWD